MKRSKAGGTNAQKAAKVSAKVKSVAKSSAAVAEQVEKKPTAAELRRDRLKQSKQMRLEEVREESRRLAQEAADAARMFFHQPPQAPPVSDSPISILPSRRRLRHSAIAPMPVPQVVAPTLAASVAPATQDTAEVAAEAGVEALGTPVLQCTAEVVEEEGGIRQGTAEVVEEDVAVEASTLRQRLLKTQGAAEDLEEFDNCVMDGPAASATPPAPPLFSGPPPAPNMLDVVGDISGMPTSELSCPDDEMSPIIDPIDNIDAVAEARESVNQDSLHFSMKRVRGGVVGYRAHRAGSTPHTAQWRMQRGGPEMKRLAIIKCISQRAGKSTLRISTKRVGGRISDDGLDSFSTTRSDPASAFYTLHRNV